MQQPQYVPGTTRLKDTELVVPVATGTVAFHLGKRANDTATHRWTAYVRSPQGGDLAHVLRAVTFTLHPSFDNHVRTVEQPPYELTETGWGEFDIGVTVSWWCWVGALRDAKNESKKSRRPALATNNATPSLPPPPPNTTTQPTTTKTKKQLHFSPDSGERDVQLTQRLRLYSEDDPTGARSVNVPVVTETIDELVFSEPQAAFLGRVAAASGRRADGGVGNLPPAQYQSSVQAHFPAPDASEARDLAPLQEARRRVAVIAASLRNQAAAMAALSAAGG